MSRRAAISLAAAFVAALAVFSLVFTQLAQRNLWPSLPAGALHDTDLWAGVLGGIVLLFLLVRGFHAGAAANERTRGRADAETRRNEIGASSPRLPISASPRPMTEPRDDRSTGAEQTRLS